MADDDIPYEFVPSERGRDKLVVNGHLYTHNSKSHRKNGDEVHYWRCEEQECSVSIVTVLKDGKHKVEQVKEHPHAAEASRVPVVKVKNAIKRKAIETGDVSARIVQNAVTGVDANIRPYLPTNNALKQTIKRARLNQNVEAQTLDDLQLPDEYKQTLNDEQFLIKERRFSQRLLI